MNKKRISVILSMVMFFNMTALVYADKKDVADPVLKEIIAELNNKMPRFINKYGAAVFVADEQITRGSLLSALYEYDKKNSAGSSSQIGMVSKKDYDLLSSRLAALEKDMSLSKTGKGGSAAVGASNVDIIKVINDLEPNMPMLLDNSLASSKVFKNLQKQVEMSSAAGASSAGAKGQTTNAQVLYDLQNVQKEVAEVNNKINLMETRLASSKVSSGAGVTAVTPSNQELEDLRRSVIQMQKSYVSIAKRVDSLEDEKPAVYASSSNPSDSQIRDLNAKINSIRETVSGVPTSDFVQTQIRKSSSQTSEDIKKIEKRLVSLEKSGKGSSDNSSSGSSSGTTSTVTKISLGLTFVAALFIAR